MNSIALQQLLSDYSSILQATLAKLDSDTAFVQVSLAKITWYHHISLISKVKDLRERAFYIMETARNGWSRDVMLMQVDSHLYERSGKAINNFTQTLPSSQSDLAKAVFKDPYNFAFIEMPEVKSSLPSIEEIEKGLEKE